MEKKVLAIIPARYASTRFPGKPLVKIGEKSIIQRVYEQAKKAKQVDEVIVATDDDRIYQHVKEFEGNVTMTSEAHSSGTDRCAEVAQKYPSYQWVVNIQGDEPFIAPQQIDLAIEPLIKNEKIKIGTLAKPLKDKTQLFNPNVVKVNMRLDKTALYFSRHPIPFYRSKEKENWMELHQYYKHIGIYAFDRLTLTEIAQLPQTLLEKAESLEQLRWLENGYDIFVGITALETIGVDTPEDLQKVIEVYGIQ
ncbi:MAG: 3-deoxy-manno-octulosonate cytidylyltransferase [Bacteroidota bacterium]